MIKDELGLQVNLEKGKWGQFEIVVNNQTVLSRRGGLIAKLMNRPWPDNEEVLAAIRSVSE